MIRVRPFYFPVSLYGDSPPRDGECCRFVPMVSLECDGDGRGRVVDVFFAANGQPCLDREVWDFCVALGME